MPLIDSGEDRFSFTLEDHAMIKLMYGVGLNEKESECLGRILTPGFEEQGLSERKDSSKQPNEENGLPELKSGTITASQTAIKVKNEEHSVAVTDDFRKEELIETPKVDKIDKPINDKLHICERPTVSIGRTLSNSIIQSVKEIELKNDSETNDTCESTSVDEEIENLRRSLQGSKRETIYFGSAPNLPEGWRVKKLKRTGGCREGRIDTYIYSKSGKRFKSMVEVRNFLDALETNCGNEKKAYKERRQKKSNTASV